MYGDTQQPFRKVIMNNHKNTAFHQLNYPHKSRFKPTISKIWHFTNHS
ncbi:hypothetical protein BCLUESOX_2298 [bacterium endosymbiont of Bathymodiolus sp. 5 South]|nr:hypothetical protein [uncultured Gammaproteobacteria bacterium]SHN89846.1 hypothetical protein BCLUESOX_2298 [bacterium endosymbiont of Bathymodiolus sp. 5 South]VVH62461.1 hypothetical protein BSPWISOX_2071 [uncultured Gammaproteobacteria bacterium]